VGHVTVDVMPDGTRRAGGAAFYAALQAARLGMRALIITQGVASEIEALLAAHRDELELRILPAPATTTLATSGAGAERVQRVLAWAGPIEHELELDTAILHLAPVARETPGHWRGRAGFVGLTPQGMARTWPRLGAPISLAAPSEHALGVNVDAIALSMVERSSCSGLISRANAAGAVVAITDGARPCTLMLADGRTRLVEIPALEEALDDLGAGDVFAAALFSSLADGLAAETAVSFAAAAAAVRMSGRGAQAVGTRAAVQRRYSTAGVPPG
jgi:sugar/nucleoside kinase (ribokinase family)